MGAPELESSTPDGAPLGSSSLRGNKMANQRLACHDKEVAGISSV